MMSDSRLPAKFWAKVNKAGPVPPHQPEMGPCWEWTGRKCRLGYGNYGRLFRGRFLTAAHRRHWIVVNGEIGEGLELDHLCRNRACVRLDHLEPVTHAENCRRGLNGVLRPLTTTCRAGHPYETYGTRNAIQWVCRECCRLKMRVKRASTKVAPIVRTHCPRGHAYDMIGGHGERGCRTCQRAQALAWYYRDRDRKRLAKQA